MEEGIYIPAIVFGGALAFVGASVAFAWHKAGKICRERDYIMQNLDKIADETREKGKDEKRWVVETDVSGLPEHSGSFFDGVFSRHYKSPAESPSEYLQRVFGDSFEFYRDGDLLVAQRKHLSLQFDLSEGGTDTREERVRIFQSGPEYIDIDKVPIRTHNSRVRYKSFTDYGSAEGLEKVEKPDKVWFEQHQLLRPN